jgi:hypothetical protein
MAPAGSTGYSGTPLHRKLGLKPGMTLAVIGAPADYRSWLGSDMPPGVDIQPWDGRALQAAHLFTAERATLQAALKSLRQHLAPAGFVWVSWPKRTSKMPCDFTEDGIREVALPMGFVDIKVCAVTEVWSGLKLVIRKSERG